MNCVLHCQKNKIVINVLKRDENSVFLDQASHLTGGKSIRFTDSVLSILFNEMLIGQEPLNSADVIDFKTICHCHRKLVDIGKICSVCMRLYCETGSEGDFSCIC